MFRKLLKKIDSGFSIFNRADEKKIMKIYPLCLPAIGFALGEAGGSW